MDWIDFDDTIRVICGTILVLAMVGMFFFGFWTDYQIQKEHLEIEKMKYQCVEVITKKQEKKQWSSKK